MDADFENLIPTLEADTAHRLAQLTNDLAGLRRMRDEMSPTTESK